VLAEPSALRAADRLWHGVPADDAAVLTVGAGAVAVFSPAAVSVYREQPRGSPRNSVRVRIAELDLARGVVRVRAAEQADGLPGLAADVTPEAVADLRLAVGDLVWFAVKTQSVSLHAGLRSD